MERMGVLVLMVLIWALIPPVAAQVEISDMEGVTPFADLSAAEIKEVMDYLSQQTSLNLVSLDKATMSDSFIFLIEAIRPPKAATLRYLDDSGPLPQRAARVILQRGDLQVPQMQEYRVYPIPKPANVEQIKNPKWRDPIPFNSRSPLNRPQLAAVGGVFIREITPIFPIIYEISGGYGFANCEPKCLTWVSGYPTYLEPGHHKMTVVLVRDLEGHLLHPIGVQLVFNFDKADPKEWFLENIWIQGQYFRNATEVLQARKQNSLNATIVPDPDDPFGESLPSSLNFRGEPRPTAAQRKPYTLMPDGNRFSVTDRHVKWMGWEFEFSMLTSSGIQLHNIKFLKERIAYELSLQEILVFYSGDSPSSRYSTFYDSHVILGAVTSRLFPGIDCPSHAQFFDFVHYVNGIPHIFPNGACVFEHDRGIPLRRYYASNYNGGYYHAHGIPDSVLIFRNILTVYNYEYIIDFMFHQAGQIETKVTLSGYVIATYYTGPKSDKYGNVINVPTTLANIHHHTAHFKADLDIKGTSNRFETLDIHLENITDELNEGETMLNRYFVHNLKKTEREAAYKFNFSNPKYLVMYNEAEKNKFGNSKGYRIFSESMSKVLLPDSYRGFRARAWTTYQVAVTKHKEDEQFSSSIYATMEPWDPVMSFEDYIDDNEGIVDEDLVAWVTLGTHHIPHSEDVPIVTTPGVQLTFYLLPYNYFNEDPSMASRDNIRVTPSDKGPVFKYSGVSGEGACPKPPPPMVKEGETASPAVKDSETQSQDAQATTVGTTGSGVQGLKQTWALLAVITLGILKAIV